jgi:RAB6A-GEF complex partner protein 2
MGLVPVRRCSLVMHSNGKTDMKPATNPHRSFSGQSSPLYNSSYPLDRNSVPHRPSGAATVPNTPSVGPAQSSPKPGSDAVPGFKFPMVHSPLSDTTGNAMGPYGDGAVSPTTGPGEAEHQGVPPREPPVPTISAHNSTPAARVLSTTSIAGTPRSSGEFYSLSNNSTETLASEYVAHQPLRTQARPPHLRQRSNLSLQKAKMPESLMMGYAQIQGSFTLDGSLVNLAPFEHVKRKGVVGGQGGGVIGVETTKKDAGLLRGFGWGNLTSSIGELLGAGELSSIKEMRGIASSKSVPLLSTPQSILFVDLQLAPGQSKSFEYSFRLPKGLPPTHRGKAMKIAYSLVIGTQRPGGAREQQVRSVEIPFRVLGSVNSHGEILGHDLMSPYVLLRDQARVQSVDKAAHRHEIHQKGNKPRSESTLNGFVAYVEELLASSNDGSTGGLLSPTATLNSRRPSIFEDIATAREAIDLAIIRSNLTAEGAQSANRFEIARNGRRVGVVMLARPAYRLGESVSLAIDFAGAQVPCYAVHAALETAERVEPALALRSEASIHRASRRIYASASEATLFARRIVFAPSIPAAATPEFVTSGVSLEWKVRLEFVVPAQVEESPNRRRRRGNGEADDEETGSDEDDEDEDGGSPRDPTAGAKPAGPHPLLEEMYREDRGGLVLIAAENLACESFEVAVPLRVYGAVTSGLERLERDDVSEEGLAV